MRDLYTIASSGTIACLGGITAPINIPFTLQKKDVISLLNNGHEIYKHNPAKTSEKVLVTLENINSITFGVTTAQAVEERILQKSIREEQTKYVAQVHTKNTDDIPNDEETFIEQIEETNVDSNSRVEDTNESVHTHNGKHSDKKGKNQNKLNAPDSFQKS